MSIRSLPTFTWAAAQLRGRRELKAEARIQWQTATKTNPPTPQFQAVLTDKTSYQQASASLIQSLNSKQAPPALLTLQPENCCNRSQIRLRKNFRRQNQSPSRARTCAQTRAQSPNLPTTEALPPSPN